MNTQILLADDHEIFRTGLRGLLEQHPGLAVVAEASEGLQAVETALEMRPDVAVMDLSMPGVNGLEATRRITERAPGVKVLCLSMHADADFVLGALDAGASGYLVKECALEELVRALGVMMEGKTYLSPRIAGLVVDAYRDGHAEVETPDDAPLSPRERDVLQGIVEGLCSKEIAARLFISPKTVSTHRQHLMDKLDIHTVAGLTKYGIRHRMTTAAA